MINEIFNPVSPKVVNNLFNDCNYHRAMIDFGYWNLSCKDKDISNKNIIDYYMPHVDRNNISNAQAGYILTEFFYDIALNKGIAFLDSNTSKQNYDQMLNNYKNYKIVANRKIGYSSYVAYSLVDAGTNLAIESYARAGKKSLILPSAKMAKNGNHYTTRATDFPVNHPLRIIYNLVVGATVSR